MRSNREWREMTFDLPSLAMMIFELPLSDIQEITVRKRSAADDEAELRVSTSYGLECIALIKAWMVADSIVEASCPVAKADWMKEGF